MLPFFRMSIFLVSSTFVAKETRREAINQGNQSSLSSFTRFLVRVAIGHDVCCFFAQVLPHFLDFTLVFTFSYM